MDWSGAGEGDSIELSRGACFIIVSSITFSMFTLIHLHRSKKVLSIIYDKIIYSEVFKD